MLQTYADIDERVRSLGYIMKVFAKVVASLLICYAFHFSHESDSHIVFCKSCDVQQSESSDCVFF